MFAGTLSDSLYDYFCQDISDVSEELCYLKCHSVAFLPLKNVELTHRAGGWGGREGGISRIRFFG